MESAVDIICEHIQCNTTTRGLITDTLTNACVKPLPWYTRIGMTILLLIMFRIFKDIINNNGSTTITIVRRIKSHCTQGIGIALLIIAWLITMIVTLL